MKNIQLNLNHENRLIFMAEGENLSTLVDDSDKRLNLAEKKEDQGRISETKEKLSVSFFKNKKDKAIERITRLLNLDGVDGISKKEDNDEYKIFNKLKEEVDEKFKDMILLYQGEAADIGTGHDKWEIRKEELKEKTETFIEEIDFRISQLNLKKGSPKAIKEAKIKILKTYLEDKGIGHEKEFLPYLAEVIDDTGKLEAGSQDELNAKLKGLLEDNPNLIKKATKGVLEKVNKFINKENNDVEESYITKLIHEHDSWALKFGSNNEARITMAAKMLSKRFNINFDGVGNKELDGTKEIIYMTDLMTGKVYSGEDVERHIGRVTRSIGSTEELKEQIKEVDNKENGWKNTKNEITEGVWNVYEGGKIDKISDIDGHEGLGKALDFNKSIEKGIDRLSGSGEIKKITQSLDFKKATDEQRVQLRKVESSLTVDNISRISKNSEKGFGALLKELLDAISSLYKGGDYKKLSSYSESIKSGTNPIKEKSNEDELVTEEVKKNEAERFVEGKKGDFLIKTYLNPDTEYDKNINDKNNNKEAFKTAIFDAIRLKLPKGVLLNGIEKSNKKEEVALLKVKDAKNEEYTIVLGDQSQLKLKDSTDTIWVNIDDTNDFTKVIEKVINGENQTEKEEAVVEQTIVVEPTKEKVSPKIDINEEIDKLTNNVLKTIRSKFRSLGINSIYSKYVKAFRGDKTSPVGRANVRREFIKTLDKSSDVFEKIAKIVGIETETEEVKIDSSSEKNVKKDEQNEAARETQIKEEIKTDILDVIKNKKLPQNTQIKTYKVNGAEKYKMKISGDKYIVTYIENREEYTFDKSELDQKKAKKDIKSNSDDAFSQLN